MIRFETRARENPWDQPPRAPRLNERRTKHARGNPCRDFPVESQAGRFSLKIFSGWSSPFGDDADLQAKSRRRFEPYWKIPWPRGNSHGNLRSFRENSQLRFPVSARENLYGDLRTFRGFRENSQLRFPVESQAGKSPQVISSSQAGQQVNILISYQYS